MQTSVNALPCDTDLFPAKPAAAVVAVVAAAPSVLRTDELQMAVALSIGGFGEPEIVVVGKTKSQEPKVEFIFDVPAGKTARDLEEQFYRKKIVSDVATVFEKSRALKKRIANEGKYSA